MDQRKYLILIAILAAVIFVPLFVFRQIGALDFWWWMSLNLAILISLSLYADSSFSDEIRNDLRSDLIRKTGLGIASAVFLYFVFYTGNITSRLLFNFASDQIHNVYSFRGDASPLRVGILMLGIIGPGEELFWRGYIQQNLQKRFGKMNGFLLGAVFYTGVHVATGNVMLILAALVCGLFWGAIYMYTGSLLTVMVSHTLWDIAAFILFPFQ